MIIFLNSQKDKTSFADKVNNNKCKKTKKSTTNTIFNTLPHEQKCTDTGIYSCY